MPFPFEFGGQFGDPQTWQMREDAIRAWVKACSGFGNSQVIWAEQTGARPAESDFITIRIGDIVALGAVDEQIEEFDDSRPAGEEVEERVIAMREFSVSVQMFSNKSIGNGTSRFVMSKVQCGLGLPSIQSSFDDVGISVFDRGQIRNVAELVGTKFEARAVLEVRFYAVETTSEFVGYIDSVEADSYMGPPDLGTREDIDI
jgi:hypothetical protein